MQCFLMGYRGICHLSLVFSLYTHSPRNSQNLAFACIGRKNYMPGAHMLELLAKINTLLTCLQRLFDTPHVLIFNYS